ncbi:MAG TPA: NAD-dependent epimerase/dehydratase family protein [Verrucomicrobiota bacterium]|nr:dTDP-glucose 4,6-dehydratase [Verrucomicrobiales bacterium]HRI16669.1 NAD-dependent epimerase/dehydratase family protein [Verrucomicrobiota bacterium]
MRTLITGGAGFIGSHLAAACVRRGRVRVLDDLSTGEVARLAGLNIDFRHGSITDQEAVVAAMIGVDVVFHLAAFVSVPASVADPARCAELNIDGLLNVLTAAGQAGVTRWVFASSSAVYGDDPTVPKVETMTPQPCSPYAQTKLDGERLAERAALEGRISTVTARFFNVFGPGQRPESAYAAAVPKFITRALAGKPLLIHGDGEQTRDFVLVEDVVQALLHLAERTELSGEYNVGYGQATTIQRLGEEIVRLTDSRSLIEHGPERPGDIRHSVASTEKLRATGWRPQHTLESGLAQTIASYRR